jgi:hypothetical protein
MRPPLVEEIRDFRSMTCEPRHLDIETRVCERLRKFPHRRRVAGESVDDECADV